jgi:hypothetical protein
MQRKEPVGAAGRTRGQHHQADFRVSGDANHEGQQCERQPTPESPLPCRAPSTSVLSRCGGLESTPMHSAKLCITTLSCRSRFPEAARQPSLSSTRLGSVKQPFVASRNRPVIGFAGPRADFSPVRRLILVMQPSKDRQSPSVPRGLFRGARRLPSMRWGAALWLAADCTALCA